MPEEHSPLGTFFVQSYDADDTSYPIVAVKKYPRVPGYEIPADLSAPIGEIRNLTITSHQFTGVTPVADDRSVMWMYMILPGPWVPERDYDPLAGPVQVRRRSVANSGQSSSQIGLLTTTYASRDGSDLVLWEIERTYSDGTGAQDAATNPAFPVRFDDTYEKERGPIQVISQLVVATGAEVGSLAVVANGIVSRTITNDGTTPYTSAPTVTIADSGGGTGTGATAIATINASGDVVGLFITNPGSGYTTPLVSFSGGGGAGAAATVAKATLIGVLTEYRKFEGNRFLLDKTVETWALPAVLLRSEEPNLDGTITITERRLARLSDIGEGEDAGGTNQIVTSSEPYSETMAWQVVRTRNTPGNQLLKLTYPYGEAGLRVEGRTFILLPDYIGRTANGTANVKYPDALLVDEYVEDKTTYTGTLVQIYDQVPVAEDQDELGYFVDYPWGSTSYPRLTWRFHATRIGYSPAAFGSACPIAGFTSLVLTRADDPTQGEQLTEIIVSRTFEILPGIAVTKTRIDDDGAVVTVTRQVVQASTITSAEAVAANVWSMIYKEEQDDSTFVAFKVTESRALSTGTSPIIEQNKWDEENRVQIGDFWQYVPVGTTLPVVGAVYNSTAKILVHHSVASLSITDPGSGYTTIPTLTIETSPGSGVNASGATVTSLKAVSATIQNPGAAVAIGTVFTVSGGTSSTAATVTVSGGSLSTLALNAAGTGYVVNEVVTLEGGVYDVPAAITVATIKLVSIASLAAGSGYAIGDTLTLVNATATFSTASILTVATAKLVSIAINAGGAGYNVADTLTLTITGGTASIKAIITVATIGGGGSIATFTITTAGSYSVLGTAATQFATSGGGAGATFQTGLWGVLTFTISTAGVYTVGVTGSAAPYTHTGGTGTGATFNTAVFGINTFTVSGEGNYTTAPTTFTQQSSTAVGLGATFQTAVYLPSLLTVSNGGVYTVIPDSPVSMTSGTMTAVLSFGLGTVTGPSVAGTLYYVEFPAVTVSYGTAQVTAIVDALQVKAGVDGYVVDNGLLNTEHALIKRMVWTMMPLPPSRKSNPFFDYEFPAILQMLTDERTEAVPSPGYDYNLIPHRRARFPGRESIIFLTAQATNLPPVFVMISPASASKLFPIPNNTQHSRFSWRRLDADGVVRYGEIFRASTPYRPGQVLTVQVSQKPFRGNMWVVRIIQISELRPIF